MYKQFEKWFAIQFSWQALCVYCNKPVTITMGCVQPACMPTHHACSKCMAWQTTSIYNRHAPAGLLQLTCNSVSEIGSGHVTLCPTSLSSSRHMCAFQRTLTATSSPYSFPLNTTALPPRPSTLVKASACRDQAKGEDMDGTVRKK